jgi:hypothetical protein
MSATWPAHLISFQLIATNNVLWRVQIMCFLMTVSTSSLLTPPSLISGPHTWTSCKYVFHSTLNTKFHTRNSNKQKLWFWLLHYLCLHIVTTEPKDLAANVSTHSPNLFCFNFNTHSTFICYYWSQTFELFHILQGFSCYQLLSMLQFCPVFFMTKHKYVHQSAD